jgi:hypothetical protein
MVIVNDSWLAHWEGNCEMTDGRSTQTGYWEAISLIRFSKASWVLGPYRSRHINSSRYPGSLSAWHPFILLSHPVPVTLNVLSVHPCHWIYKVEAVVDRLMGSNIALCCMLPTHLNKWLLLAEQLPEWWEGVLQHLVSRQSPWTPKLACVRCPPAQTPTLPVLVAYLCDSVIVHCLRVNIWTQCSLLAEITKLGTGDLL